MGYTAATLPPSESAVNVGTPNSPDLYYPYTNPTAGTALSAEDWPQNKELPLVFTPLTIKGMEFKNRVFVGAASDYSLGSRHHGFDKVVLIEHPY